MSSANERIKEIRKSLGLSLEKFSERLGVGRTAISKIELGENRLTDRMLLAICQVYNINEDWLRNGTGQMFASDIYNEIDAVVEKHHLDNNSGQMLKEFIELSDDERAAILKYMANVVNAIKAEEQQEQEHSIKTAADLTDDDIEKAGEEYKEQLRLEKKRAERSLLFKSTGSDT